MDKFTNKVRRLCYSREMRKRFQRRVEDFTCEHCWAKVIGDGYTDHCPQCLWSKHVDINPGDRAATCGGMMKPVALEGSSPHYRILHKCTRCGGRRIQDAQSDDNPSALVALSAQHST